MSVAWKKKKKKRRAGGVLKEEIAVSERRTEKEGLCMSMATEVGE